MPAAIFRPFAIAFLAILPALAAAQKKPSDIPVEDFFRRPQYSQMVLSPDGRKLAALTPFKGRDNLVVVDLEKRTRNVITAFEAVDATGVFWVNNKRLCMRVFDGQVATGEPVYRGMYCIDADGENLRDFTRVAGVGGNRGLAPVSPVFDESGEFIMEMRQRSRRSADLYRFDTNTGRYQILTGDSPGDVAGWVLDRNLVPRIAVSTPLRERSGKPRRTIVWHRAGMDAKWEKLWEFEGALGGLGEADVHFPVAFDFDNETLYVATNRGRDKAAIHAFDTKTKTMGNLLVEHPLIDLMDGLIFNRQRKKLVGVAIDAEKPLFVWTDKEFAAMQQAIDAALPKTLNVLSFARDNPRRALVTAFSDVDPGTYYLFDADQKKLEPIVKRREWIDPSLMAERKFIVYKARDGTEIPAWVTIPRGGGKNLPLVVNIHGGPWGRAYSWASGWARWPEAQFFASRGYVVLEPEPRGSVGFGRKHIRSAFKQWGLTMQDDITDGALHLVKEGLVDRDRMCLHGGSYGGYATLQGLVKDPDLWKCGSAFVAVTDLGLMQEVVYSDMNSIENDFLQEDFPYLVGDKDKDRELFDKVSPLRNAAKIKARVLLAMGSNDIRVPQVHGDRMRSALEDAGRKVEYVVYSGEAHGFNKDDNVFDHYRRIERMLKEVFR